MQEFIAMLQYIWIEHGDKVAVVLIALVAICFAIKRFSNKNIEED